MANLCYARKKLSVVLIAFLVFIIAECEVKRNLSLQLNPDCDEYPECKNSNVSIFYIEAIGPNDTLHNLWSTQGGIPSALIVQTNPNAQLKINWTILLSHNPENAISFTEKPFYSFGMLLTRLLQYNDVHDTGNMSNYICEAMDFSGVNWIVSNKINHSDLCSVTFQTSDNSTEFLQGGDFIFQVSAFGDDNRGEKLPRLLHNSNNNEIGIILNHLKINSSNSRFALEFMSMYNSEEKNNSLQKKENSNLDDEFTPGVFSTIELLTDSSNCSDLCRGYLLWKPIAYTDKDLTVSLSTDVKIYDIKQIGSIPSKSIIFSYFENDKSVQISTWNISFGMKGDKFFEHKNYSSWYLTIGLGIPPEDSPTIALILTIAIGFGTPFICMIAGGIYIGIRKLFKKEDDLLLSRESM